MFISIKDLPLAKQMWKLDILKSFYKDIYPCILQAEDLSTNILSFQALWMFFCLIQTWTFYSIAFLDDNILVTAVADVMSIQHVKHFKITYWKLHGMQPGLG